MFAAALNVALAVLMVPWELIKMAKMFGEFCQQLRKDDIKESEMSRAIETTDNDTIDINTTKNETNIETNENGNENTTIETVTSCSSGYDTETDEDSIQFNIIKTPPGVKSNRVIAFRRGLVKKNCKIFEHCG